MRNKIAKKLETILKEKYQENDVIFCADWDNKRISHEDSSIMEYLYFENVDAYYNILEEACKGTGYFLENINSCELTICKK